MITFSSYIFNFLIFTLIQFSKFVMQMQYKSLHQRWSQAKAPARTKLHSWYWVAKLDRKTLQSYSGSAGWAVTSDFTSQNCYYPFIWIICPSWVAKSRLEPQRVLWGTGLAKRRGWVVLECLAVELDLLGALAELHVELQSLPEDSNKRLQG